MTNHNMHVNAMLYEQKNQDNMLCISYYISSCKTAIYRPLVRKQRSTLKVYILEVATWYLQLGSPISVMLELSYSSM